jgi:hypothetical protein
MFEELEYQVPKAAGRGRRRAEPPQPQFAGLDTAPPGPVGTMLRDGTTKLCGITPHLLAHFEITRLHHYFEIYRERSSALRACSKRSLSLCAV